MAVQGDTCLFSVLQMSSLNSCYVWIKRTGSGSLAAPTRSVTLNCIPCQLQTRCVAEEVTGLTPLFLSLHPVSYLLPFVCFTGHSISMPPTPCITVKEKTEWCTEDTSQSDGGTFLNTPIKHKACLVRLPWHPLSKSLPRLREAEKQMSWVCLPLLDRAVKICSWRTLKTAQMERMTCLRFSLFLCREWVSWGETINCCKCCWSIHPKMIPSAPNKFVYVGYLHYLINLVPAQFFVEKS